MVTQNNSNEQVDRYEIKMWLERLRRSKTDEKAASAASRLGYHGIRTRGSIRTRGTINQPAGSRFPSDMEEEAMETVLEALDKRGPEVKKEVISALGEWGDEKSVSIIGTALEDIKSRMGAGQLETYDEDVISAAIDSLRRIGGPKAVGILQDYAKNGPTEGIRYSAIEALGDLADMSARSTIPTGGVIRTRGSVRTRGGRKSRLSADAKKILNTLKSIIKDEEASENLRISARRAVQPFETEE